MKYLYTGIVANETVRYFYRLNIWLMKNSMKKYGLPSLLLLFLLTNHATAQTRISDDVYANEYHGAGAKGVELPDYSKYSDQKLKRKLFQQRLGKGFGIFNMVWGGMWLAGGTVATISSDEDHSLGIAAAAIGAGAGYLGLKRKKRAKLRIEAIKNEMELRASRDSIGPVGSF